MSQHNHTLNLVVHWTVYGAVALACAGVAVMGARLAWGARDGTVDDRLVCAALWLAALSGAVTLARVLA